MLYSVRKDWKQLPAILAGASLPPLAFGLVDAFSWHSPFQSFIRFFQANILQGRAQSFGTAPWNTYLSIEAEHLGPLILLAILGVRRSKVLGDVALIVIASHSLIAHKEVRFVYPATPILIVLAALGLWELLRAAMGMMSARMLARMSARTTPSLYAVLAGVAFFALCSSLSASQFSYWKDTEAMDYFHQLSQQDNVCGVALYGVAWHTTGGYSYLHHPAPIIIPAAEDFSAEARSFDFVVAGQEFPLPDPSFHRLDCSQRVCLYQRPGACAPASRKEINAVLAEYGY